MRAVSNTSPLLNLAIVDHLHLLRQQYATLLIPPAVRAELQVDRRWLGSARLRAILAEGWVQVGTPPDPVAVAAFGEHVDLGEAEAIALALGVGADWLLIDERDGRALATRLGLRVTGVLGVLLRAKSAGDLDALAPLLGALQREAGFRVAPPLRQAVLAAAGEA
jgi:predicted nucleic acid-binding protein